MQDIDFDEIDRAVSSITSTNTETGTSDASLSPAAPAPVAVDSPAVRRSGGRFMDVVHPSSDMRPPVSPRPAAPFAPTLHREEVPERSETVESRPEPAAVSSSAFHWPDSIEAMTPAPEPAPAPVDATPSVESAPTPLSTPDLASVSTNDETANSLESPFLTDAKVEKRPLGAFSSADTDLPLIEDPIPADQVQAPAVPAQTATEAPVEAPAETPAETPAVTSSDAPAETPAIPEAPATPEIDLDTVAMTPATSTEDLHELHQDVLSLDGHGQEVPVGPTSITQQYKEQPQIANEPAGSIFDTEAYHQPLTHTAKKHSGALIAVWIVALILVGAGVGAGIYFVVLPLLG